MAKSLFAFFILIANNIFPQTTIEFDQWTTSHGLSQVSVFAMMQDREGYLWFATENGLNQFDGYQFTHYTHNLFDSNSLSDQLVYLMIEDKKGFMWVACFGGGLNRFDRSTGKFTHFRHDPNNTNSISSDFVTTVYISPNQPDILWVGTDRGGLNRFDMQSGVFTNYKHRPDEPNSLCNDRIYGLSGDNYGNIWIGTRKGLSKFDPEKNTFANFFSGTPKNTISHDEIWHIFKDRDGKLWFSTTEGLTRCDPSKPDSLFKIFRHDPRDPSSLPHKKVWATSDDDRRYPEYLWVGTQQGLARMNKTTGQCTIFKHDDADPRTIGHNQVWALYNDRYDNIWVGSFGGGVNRVNRSKEKFNHYRNKPNDPNSLRHNEMWALHEDRSGNIWAGHRKGVDVFDESGRRVMSIDNANGNESTLKIEGTRVQSILEDSEGIVWLGTDGAGFYSLDQKQKRLKHYQHRNADNNSLSNDFVSYIYESKNPQNKFLWICTNSGLNRFDRRTEQFTHYQVDSSDSKSISHDRVRYITEDSRGILWVGTYGGLDRFDPALGEFIHHKNDPNNLESISENRVWVIHESRDGALWIGTHIGLNRLNQDGKSFKSYTEREGLSGNEIYGITEDTLGNLWISTSRGISRFNLKKGSFENFFEDDGLQSNEFNGAVFAQGQKGRLYFGGINGFSAFYPEQILADSNPPPIVFTTFRKFDQPILKDRVVNGISSLELSYSDNFFGFEFSALSYHNVSKNRYRYKMDGFDPEWIESGKRRYASYTNLDPGTYRFLVTASNSSGFWNPDGASMTLTILPPWWQTWWFRTLLIASVAGVLGFIYHLRVERLLEIERMRTRIASDLHDDIGSTLTRIAVGSESIRSTGDTEKIHTTAERIGELSREVIRTFSDVVWSIDARNDKLGDLIARLQDTAYQILTPKEINCQFSVLTIDSEKQLAVDVRQNVFLIVKEAFHNIAKHSGATAVTATFQGSPGRLSITIHDNGKGLPEDIRTQGNGLKNMRMRAERIRATLGFENKNGLVLTLNVPA